MTKSNSSVAESAYRSFVRTTGLFRNRMDPYFASFGITAAQWGVLRTLQRAEAEGLVGLRLTDLGKRLLVQPPSMTGVVERLQRSGLVARTTATDDLRAKQVRLTAAGHALLARVLRHHPKQIQTIMAGLNPQEQADLHRLMERMAAHLETIGAPGGPLSAPALPIVERPTP